MSVEDTNIITLNVKVKKEKRKAFVDWQSKLNASITTFPGFLSLEIISPKEQETLWVIIERFSTSQCALDWENSKERKELLEDLYTFIQEKDCVKVKSSGSSVKSGVTEVFVTKVTQEMESSYRQWIAKIHHAEATFQGFRGVYVQSPTKSHEENWITFLQFDTPENLDNWLISKERQQILEELKPFISSIESHRVISPYGSWFSSLAKDGELPPVWKQTMLVLLILFPMIMLEFKFLEPFTKGFDISVATFIGNAISVTLIAWPGMPIAIFLLGWWLTTRDKILNIIGTLIVLLLYLVEIIAFYNFI